MLRAAESDLIYLSEYLHDAILYDSDISWYKESGLLKIRLERLYLEQPKHSRWLFIIPIIKYSGITSELRLRNVQSLDKQWFGKIARREPLFYTLTELGLEDNRLYILGDGLQLIATLSSYHPVELEDVSLPTKHWRCRDLFKDVSRYDNWRHDIERMRVDV